VEHVGLEDILHCIVGVISVELSTTTKKKKKKKIEDGM